MVTAIPAWVKKKKKKKETKLTTFSAKRFLAFEPAVKQKISSFVLLFLDVFYQLFTG